LKAQEGRKMQPKAALDVIVQVADAVNRIHREGVIHRDLKPSNIILRKEDNSPVIIDFGISKGEEKTNLTMDKIIGTPRYMAPEQLNGQTDARTDVYSLATILFEMIAGAPAYPYADHAEISERLKQPSHPTRIVQYARNVHPFLRQLVEAGREKDPDARLTDEEFLDAARELVKAGKYYQDAPLGASSTLIRKERSRALRRIKMEHADAKTLEHELQACALDERASNIKHYLDQEEFTRAKEELDKLQQDLKALPERGEELQADLEKFTARLKAGIALRQTQTQIARASEARNAKDYVQYGLALDLVENGLAELPEKNKATLDEVYKCMRKEYEDNFRRHVGKFMVAKEHLDSAQTAYDALEQGYAAKKPVAQRDIDSLLKKVDEAEADLKDHKSPENVGPAYETALAAAGELRKKATRLSPFAGALTVLNEVKQKYDQLGALYGAGNLVDRKPMEDLITQLDALVKDLSVFDPSKQGVLYKTAATYAGEMREAIADLRTRTAPKA
jgi:DNA repair exonuclease SbcCD ATPase subunit